MTPVCAEAESKLVLSLLQDLIDESPRVFSKAIFIYFQEEMYHECPVLIQKKHGWHTSLVLTGPLSGFLVDFATYEALRPIRTRPTVLTSQARNTIEYSQKYRKMLKYDAQDNTIQLLPFIFYALCRLDIEIDMLTFHRNTNQFQRLLNFRTEEMKDH